MVNITAKKVVSGREGGLPKADEFTFNLYSVGNLNTPIATAKTKADGTITFENIEVKGTGVYNLSLIHILTNYFGQAAYLLSENYNPTKNPFFAIVPENLVIIQVLLATLAAIIASQSLITGSFTLVSEAIKLNLFPKLVIKYPTDIRGQVYVSAVNIILFIFSSSVVVFFRTSSNMRCV